MAELHARSYMRGATCVELHARSYMRGWSDGEPRQSSLAPLITQVR